MLLYFSQDMGNFLMCHFGKSVPGGNAAQQFRQRSLALTALAPHCHSSVQVPAVGSPGEQSLFWPSHFKPLFLGYCLAPPPFLIEAACE